MQRAGVLGVAARAASSLLSPSALLIAMPSMHLDDAALHALQFVAGAGEHEQQEEIGHGADGGFRLSHAHGFDQNVAIAGGFAEQHGFARAARDTAEMAARGRRADERALFHGQPLHARLVAQDAAAGNGAGGVDGEDGDGFAALANQVHAERVDEGALADPRARR